jgi:hypothetical protein
MATKKKKKAAAKRPAKRAPARTSAMSKAVDLSRAEVSIMTRMSELEEETPRYQVLQSALAFKSSWVVLGEQLAKVMEGGWFRTWGYASFERFCADELFISAGTAKKLVRSFSWLGEEAPEYLPPTDDAALRQRKHDLPDGPLPDLNSISILADAKSSFEESRIPEDAYLALKQAALAGESASALRRALKESIPESQRPKPTDDRVRHLRKALTASVKTIDSLREWDADGNAGGEDLLVMAERLRDTIAIRLPKMDD